MPNYGSNSFKWKWNYSYMDYVFYFARISINHHRVGHRVFSVCNENVLELTVCTYSKCSRTMLPHAQIDEPLSAFGSKIEYSAFEWMTIMASAHGT